MLEVNNLVKDFGNKRILNNINFKIDKGDVLVVLGPSGSGKTTLLRCLKGFEDCNGAIVFNGNKTDKLGYVFQDFHVWENMTVLENLMLAPKVVQNRDHNEVYDTSINILKKVGLVNKANHYPHQLSGGQKQRAAIARSLVMKPDMLLLDEITSALDPELVQSVLNVIKQLANEGMTMVVVTHNMSFAKEIGNKFLFIDDGKIIEFGRKEIFDNPKSKRMKEFLLNGDS